MFLKTIFQSGALLAPLLLLPSKASALSGSVSGSYTGGFEPSDPIMGFGFSLSEKLNPNWSLALSQEVTRNLIYSSEKDEWVAADTRIGLSYTFFPNKDEWKLVLQGSLTLPVSESSRYLDVYSKPRLMATLSYPSTSGWETYVSAYIRDTISAFESAPSSGGEGGEILEDYGWLVAHGSSVSAFGFSLGYDISYVETIFHRQENTENEFRDEAPSQGYDFGLNVTRDLWKGASVSVSYNQGSALTQTGFEDYLIYDSATSTYTLGFLQSF